MESGGGAHGMSRFRTYESVSSAVALDLIYVTAVRNLTTMEHSYAETRQAFDKSFKRSATPIAFTKQERIRQSITAMEKYRKAR